jgi:hypothetical protein
MKDLSRTFQDAVIVARELNVRYLWIDSLCIIQDSFEDWAQESARMGQYYMNSLFNISAVSASDGSNGCFMTRNTLNITPCQVQIRFPGVNQDNSKVYFLRSPSLGWDPVTQTAPFQRPPLWQRAWVVQERLLSPRLLQFSSMQLSWKCGAMIASENVPEGTEDLYLTQEDRILRQALVGFKKFKCGKNIYGDIVFRGLSLSYVAAKELIDLYDAWYDLVPLYGKCTLTKESDIFPAISGIAEAIATATGDEYVAGLWKSDLHRGLLWSSPDSTKSKPALRRYRAPSWSWASLKATCNFYVREVSQAGLRVDKEHFRINAVTCLSSAVSPFGEITKAEMKVSGLLKRAHPKGGDEEKVLRGIEGARDNYTLFDLEEKISIGYYFDDNVANRFLTEIWCCPIITEDKTRQPMDISSLVRHMYRPVEARCLALVAIDADKRIYMRVGSVWITDFAWFDNCEISQFTIV